MGTASNPEILAPQRGDVEEGQVTQCLPHEIARSNPGLRPLANLRFEVSRLLPAVSSQPDVAATRRALGRKLLTHPGQQLIIQAWIDHQCQDTARVARYRERLQDLGWFMKALKEPLARLANKEDDCKGTFWEARYKSIAILDEQALLATCTYIDPNPFAAGIAKTPEDAPHTSIKQRVDHVRAKGDLDTLQAAAAATSVATARIEADLEQSHWLCLLQDQKTASEGSACAAREGMLPGFSLSSYLELVDWTARLCRTGKARITQEVASIMTRLGTSPEYWHSYLQKLLGKTRWLGSYCATSAERLNAIATKRCVHHVDNALGGLAAG